MPQTRPTLVASRRDLAVQIGQRLAAARTRADLSQAAAAARLGLAQSAIAKLELGDRYLTFL
jgi:transcriptional regulator with XRE-family HTH domain